MSPFRLERPRSQPIRRLSWRWLVLGLLLVVLLLAWMRRAPQPPGPRALLLITLDTTRADRLGCYGYPAARTPQIDRIAAKGVRFTDASTVAPITLPAHVTLHTGLLPLAHGVRNNGATGLPPEIPTLAQDFRDRGAATAAFVGAYVLGAYTGLDRGFDTYDDRFHGGLEKVRSTDQERRAEHVVEAALDWFATLPREAPFFCWVHLFDPHSPYAPPPPLDELFADRPYDGEITYVDQQLTRLFHGLDAQDRLAGLGIALLSDHGEGLGDHGEATHGLFLYQPTIRIPLLLAGPGLPQGRAVDRPVSIADVAPTIREWCDLPIPATPADAGGTSLLSTMRAPPDEPAPAAPRSLYLETMLPTLNYGWAPLFGLRRGDWKYIQAPTPELYDLAADPGEAASRLPAEAGRAAELAEALDRLRTLERSGPGGPLPPEVARRLESLGYVGGPQGGGASPSDSQAPDPKAMIRFHNLMSEGGQLAGAGDVEGALAAFREVLAANPGNLLVKNWVGSLLLERGEAEAARETFSEILAVDPRNDRAQGNLGAVYMHLDRPTEARTAYRRAAELNPANPLHFLALGNIAWRVQDAPTARAAYTRFLALWRGSPEMGERVRERLARLPPSPAG